MKLKKLAAATAVTSLSAALLAAAAGTAGAATAYPTPPYEPDSNAQGTITFYDATGHVQLSGSTTADSIAFAAGGSALGGTTATLYGALPENGKVPGNYTTTQTTAATPQPASALPVPLAGSAGPVVKVAVGDLPLATTAGATPNNATDAYAGLYQMRIVMGGSGAATKYAVADIKVTGSTWQQVYPNYTDSTTALSYTSTPASGIVNATTVETGSTVTLKADLTGSSTGTVIFYDGASALSSQPVVSGTASYTYSYVPALGSHAFKAAYFPTVGSNIVDSTSSVSNLSVVNPLPASYTSVATNAGATTTAADDVTITATVKTPDSTGTPVASGTVTFTDSIDGALGSAPVSSGSAVLVKKFSATSGSAQHVVTASFSDASYKSSSASAAGFTVQQVGACADPASNCTETDVFKVTVNTGTLTLTTPYTSTSPFDLGVAQLSNDGKHLLATAPFGSATSPAQGVTVTDRRAGDLPWDANVTTTDFSTVGGDVINGQNLAFTSVAPAYIGGNALNATTKPVQTYNLPTATVDGYAPAAAGSDGLKGAKRFAHADLGAGSVNIVGTMSLLAPTSTPAGVYLATVTFTIG